MSNHSLKFYEIANNVGVELLLLGKIEEALYHFHLVLESSIDLLDKSESLTIAHEMRQNIKFSFLPFKDSTIPLLNKVDLYGALTLICAEDDDAESKFIQQEPKYHKPFFHVALTGIYNSIVLHIQRGEIKKASILIDCACELIQRWSEYSELSFINTSTRMNEDMIKMAISFKYLEGCIKVEEAKIKSQSCYVFDDRGHAELYKAMDCFTHAILLGRIHFATLCTADNEVKWFLAKTYSNLAYCCVLSGDVKLDNVIYLEACKIYDSFRDQDNGQFYSHSLNTIGEEHEEPSSVASSA